MSAVGIIAALLLGILATACGNEAAPADVVATTVQIGALTREVAGDRLEVVTLIGPGVDPHDYEATADDIKQISASKVVLRNGIGLDDFLDDTIEGAGASRVVTVTEGIEPRHAEEPGHEEEGDAHGGADPHVWHDPANDKVMVDSIVRALSDAFPGEAEAFHERGEAYKRTLDETDVEIRRLIDAIPMANRKMVTNHDAFGYFIERYGLTYVGAVIPSVSTQGEATAQQLAELEETIEREQVKAIFAESSLDPKVAAQIASDTGITVVDDLFGDSLGASGSDAATVHGMLLANARKIADALK